MKLMITGHRPGKLPGGYDLTSPANLQLRQSIKDIVIKAKAYADSKQETTTLITGMALGVDTMFAEIAIELGLPFIASLPCVNQASRWNKTDQKKHAVLITKAIRIDIVSSTYTSSCMQQRNINMVNETDFVIAVWDGQPSGGTYNCIQYAKKKNKPIKYISFRKEN